MSLGRFFFFFFDSLVFCSLAKEVFGIDSRLFGMKKPLLVGWGGGGGIVPVNLSYIHW